MGAPPNASSTGGTRSTRSMSAAEAATAATSQGLRPPSRFHTGSVVERWFTARRICENATTAKAIVRPTASEPASRPHT